MAKRVIAIIAFVAVFFISVQYAEAEVIVIEGMNNYNGIFISLEENSNLIMLDTNDKNTTAFDSIINTYHDGGFSMKNAEEHVAVWLHPINDTDYRVVVLTSDGVYRMIASIISDDDVQATTQSSELVSSIGADISKWDIPTTGRSEPGVQTEIENQWNPDSLELLFSVPFKISYKHNLNFHFTAIDKQIISKNDQKLKGVSAITTITNPIGEVMGTWNGTTGNKGLYGGEYYIVDNQMLGEYKLKVSLEKENYTPITRITSFFVLPADENNNTSCPSGYFLNGTTGLCQITN